MTTKKIVLLTSLSVTAFSGLAQEDAEKLVVTATRFPQPVSTVLAPMDIVTRDEIDLWQAKSMTDVLRRLPGVDIAQSGGRGQAATLYVRGTEARHVLVLVDGIRLPVSGIMGIADFNQIPISLVQKVEFIRGPRSAVYGSEAIGGVINIITQSETDGAKIDAGLGSNHYQLYDGRVRQTIADKTTITAAGSFEDTRGFNVSPDSPYGPDRDRDGFRSKSFWAGVDHKFSSQFSAFVRGYGYSNNAEYDANSTYPNSANERQLYSRNYDMGLRFLEGNYSSQLVASYQTYKDYNFNSENGRYNDGTSLDDMTQRNIQWGNSYKLGSAVINGGIDWRQEKLESSDSYAADSYQRDNTGVYLTGQESLGDFIFEGAFRTDKNQVFGWHETWQSAVAWEFIPAYRVTLSYGTGFLAPTLGQLHGASRFGIVSNDNLKPEESRQWEAGLEGDTGPLNWRLAGYRNKITNLIGYESDPVTYDGQYINIESATIKGVEWTGSFETGVLNHRITLEYLDPRRDKDNEVLARRSKHKAKYQIDWNMFGLDMDVSYQYNGKRYDNNTSAYASEQKRLSSYSTVDVSAGYPVTEHLTVRGRVANLFDKDYQTAYKYQTAGREYYLTASYTF